jgi:guanosine-3',5'-bis(diphosphate) 3'-pyrophosphohydrolase
MTFVEDDVTLIFKALQFSAEKHRHQRRKDAEASPYINHPIDVAATLWRVGKIRDAAVLAAAILHDTLEDTDTTPQELEREFGPEVLSLVEEVTDDKTLPKVRRKALQIEHAREKSLRAKQIKLADKISNVRDVGDSPPSNWDQERRAEYLDWSQQVVEGLSGANPALESYFETILRDARARLDLT